jgi:hypothetical protein
LLVGTDDTICTSEDANWVLVVAFAGEENIVGVVSRCVVLAANAIVDVLAETNSVVGIRITSLEAEHASTDEVVPRRSLGRKLGSAAREGGRVDEATNRVTTAVLASRVELATGVVRGKIEQKLVDVTSDLNVGWGLDELDASEGASGDKTSTVGGLGAPGYFKGLRVSDGNTGLGRTPKAEIIKRVDDGGLAEDVLGGIAGAAVVDAKLLATLRRRGVGLLGDLVEREALADEDGVRCVGGVCVDGTLCSQCRGGECRENEMNVRDSHAE